MLDLVQSNLCLILLGPLAPQFLPLFNLELLCAFFCQTLIHPHQFRYIVCLDGRRHVKLIHLHDGLIVLLNEPICHRFPLTRLCVLQSI